MQRSFGDMLRGWRQARRMSQLDLALAADVSSRHVSFLETGRAEPSRAMALKLAAALEMPKAAANEALLAAGPARDYVDPESAQPLSRHRRQSQLGRP
jgi:transcriptional regulator with XRE-family HTH domain